LLDVSEIFQANDVDKFIPRRAHFYLNDLTYDNLILGSGIGPVTYEDHGTNNRITGITPMKGGVGENLKELHSEAIEAANDLRKSLF
jgi:hypothetical protein